MRYILGIHVSILTLVTGLATLTHTMPPCLPAQSRVSLLAMDIERTVQLRSFLSFLLFIVSNLAARSTS